MGPCLPCGLHLFSCAPYSVLSSLTSLFCSSTILASGLLYFCPCLSHSVPRGSTWDHLFIIWFPLRMPPIQRALLWPPNPLFLLWGRVKDKFIVSMNEPYLKLFCCWSSPVQFQLLESSRSYSALCNQWIPIPITVLERWCSIHVC